MVDSIWARYYLDHYRNGERATDWKHTAIDEALASIPDGVPDRETLRQLTRRFSADFATLVFHDRIAEDVPSRNFRIVYEEAFRRQALESKADLVGSDPATVQFASTRVDRADVTFLFVPGFLYRSLPSSGAALSEQRQALERDGWRTRLVRTVENGSVECNARIVAKAVREAEEQNSDAVIISVSKGGAETAMALGTLLQPEETNRVRAWINVCGVLYGTQLANEAARKPLRARLRLRAMGGPGDLTGVLSLTTGRSQRRMSHITLPEHVLVVNYLAVPLACHIGPQADTGYRTLRCLGPNDGRSLLADQICPGMPIVAEFGEDHYLRSSRIRFNSLAVVNAVLTYQETAWVHRSGSTGTRGDETLSTF